MAIIYPVEMEKAERVGDKENRCVGKAGRRGHVTTLKEADDKVAEFPSLQKPMFFTYLGFHGPYNKDYLSV